MDVNNDGVLTIDEIKQSIFYLFYKKRHLKYGFRISKKFK